MKTANATTLYLTVFFQIFKGETDHQTFQVCEVYIEGYDFASHRLRNNLAVCKHSLYDKGFEM